MNVVVVGQILAAVSDYTLSLAVGCIIIAVISYVISVFGFAIIHTYEKYSWIATAIILCVLLGQVAPDIDASVPTLDTGLGLSGSMLSFLAINFSSTSGWCTIASDYYCNYPAKTKSWKIFFLTFFGVSSSTIFVTVIGACLGNAALSSTINPVLGTAYNDHGLGGVLRESFHPLRFSKFCLVLLVFSVIGNNVAVNYSSGLSLQLLGHYFHAIPRFIWSLANAVVIVVLAIAGRQHLSTIVSNFVSLLGYWTVSFTLILLIEDQWFRRREGYNLNAWDQPQLLPWGLAAVLALLTGYLAGGVTGMSQTWYIGKLLPAPSMFLVYRYFQQDQILTPEFRSHRSQIRRIRRRRRCLPIPRLHTPGIPTCPLVRTQANRSLKERKKSVDGSWLDSKCVDMLKRRKWGIDSAKIHTAKLFCI